MENYSSPRCSDYVAAWILGRDGRRSQPHRTAFETAKFPSRSLDANHEQQTKANGRPFLPGPVGNVIPKA